MKQVAPHVSRPNPGIAIIRLLVLLSLTIALFLIASASRVGNSAASRPVVAVRNSTSTFDPPPLVVNAVGDAADPSIDGICDTDSGTAGDQCTLRAAIQEANAAATDSAISFDSSLNNGAITLDSALPDINANVIITGPGAALLTIQRSSAGGTPNFRIFTISSGKTVSISGLTIARGSLIGTDKGGGLLNNGALTLTNCDFFGNSVAEDGGAIFNNGLSLILNSCHVGGTSGGQANSALGAGGIWHNSGTLVMNGGSVTGNSGGGIFAGWPITLDGVAVTDNVNNSGRGGGIFIFDSTTIFNCLIANNSSNSLGGGIYNQGGTTTVANTTISGNVADGAGGGLSAGSGTLTLTNVTLTNNRTTSNTTTSGGLNASGTVNLRNTIVAGNFRGVSPGTTAGDIGGSVSFPGSFNNLTGTGGSGGLSSNINGNQTGVSNPLLGPLADNGGPTRTHALFVRSKALDAGSNTFITNPPFTGSAPFTDQRGTGFKRILDAADADTTQTVDIGAYEANPMIQTITNTFVNEDASVSCLVYNLGDETEGFSSISGTSTNQTLVKDANINPNLPNASGSRCLAIGLETNQFGSTTINLSLTGNNGRSVSTSFVLTVNPVSHPPSVTPATTNEDTQTTSGLVINRNPADGAEVIQFKITNIQNGSLFLNDGHTRIFDNQFIAVADGNAGLKFTPAADFNSSSSTFGFTVQSSGSGGLSTGTDASITVNPVNDPPTFIKGPDQIVNPSPNNHSVPNWATSISAGAPNESSQALTFQVTGNTNSALFSVQPAIDSAGTLSYTSVPNATGTAAVTINLKDNAAGADTSAPQTFNITVTPPPLSVTVRTPGDAADINVGDRICDTNPTMQGEQCTLRAAIQETNATGAASGNTISFEVLLPSPIILNSALPDINGNTTITGPGPKLLTVQRNNVGGTPNFRVFTIASGMTVSMSGLTLANGNVVGSFPANAGGGIFVSGTLTLTNTVVSGNTAAGSGGGICVDQGVLTINGSVISGNNGGAGGGLSNRGTATVNQSTIADNTAVGSGGGISNSTGDSQGNVLTVNNSTISNNISQSTGGSLAGGGGIFNIGQASATNSTISSNSALNGGAILNLNPMTLSNVTISGNSATNQGGGVYNPGIGIITLGNTIIAGNTAPSGSDCNGFNLNSQDYNLIGNTSGGNFTGTTTHNLTNVAALLGPLQDNSGPTMTHALLAGSPAVDAGNSGLTTDQRGQLRPLDDQTVVNAAGGNASDIGAYESHNLLVNSTADTDDGACDPLGSGTGNKDCTLREAINAANMQTGAEAINFAPALTSGGPAAITLATTLPDLSSDMTIAGSGANLLTVQRSSAGGTPDFRVFTINVGRTVTITGLTIANGRASDTLGGGVVNDGTLTMTSCNLFGNTINSSNNVGGAGIFNDGTLTLNSCTVGGSGVGQANSCPGGSGGIRSLGPITINGGSIVGNIGNGISIGGAATLNGVAITGNTTTVFGGGFWAFGTSVNISVSNCLIANNNASSGGGIYNGAANIAVVNTTISGNNSSNSGGGIDNFNGNLKVTNATITNNRASSGGGIDVSGAVLLNNTIVAGNLHKVGNSFAPDDLRFTVNPASSFNLIGVCDGCGLANGVNNNQVGVANPLLGSLASNGGPTQTHALLFGSPAIDAGDNCVIDNSCAQALASVLTTDQRGPGFNRLADANGDGNARVDIGAYELQSILVTNTADSGTGSLRQAIIDANANPDTTAINFQTGLSGTISLLTTLPDLATQMTINGPGAGQLTVQRSTAGGTPDFRIFQVTSLHPVIISGLTMSNGKVGPGSNGGGILNNGSLTVTDVRIIGNSADSGGGIYGSAANLTIIRSTISNNSTLGGAGGGVASFSGTDGLIIADSTIANNTVGGGLFASGNGAISNTTISNNSSVGDGGGLVADGFGNFFSLYVTNCTITGNRADSAGNTGGMGGGLKVLNITVTLFDTIVAGNFHGTGAVPDDILNNVNSASSFNLIGTGGSGGLNGANNNQVSVSNPGLGTLSNNGGQTQTHALLPGSPAINAGNNTNATNAGLIADQRGTGFPRISNTTVDIGAFESRGFGIAATGGTPQSATITTAFSSPLVATVTSAFGEPVSGGVVTFTAPGNGASGTFSGGMIAASVAITGGGIATSPVFTANGNPGSYSVRSSGNGISSSAGFSLTNDKAATATTVTSSVNPSDSGQDVTFTATVTSSISAATGMVQFNDGGTNLGAPQGLNGSGIATFSTSSLTAGTHTITADYNGDTNFAASTGTLSGGQVVKARPSLSINDASITEGASGTAILRFTVTLSATSSLTATVNYATADGTANAGSDYVGTTNTLTFSPGDLTKTVNVTVNGDTAFEPNETFFVNLSAPTNATISDAQGLGTILNDDPPGGTIVFSSPNYTVTEVAGSILISVNRNGDTTQAVTVDYATSDITADGRKDYTATRGTLRFDAGVAAKAFPVLVNADAFAEGSEFVQLTLSNPTGGAVLGLPGNATLQIDNTPWSAPPANSIDDAQTFVRQHYHDFLNRDAANDPSGLAFWTNQITECQQPGATCSTEVRRINVSAAFFLSIEFQETGYLVERLYKTAYGDATEISNFGPAHPIAVPVIRFNEFLPDTQQIGQGVVVGQTGWEQALENNKRSFTTEFVQRPRFTAVYPTSMTPAQFVDTLNTNAGNPLSTAERNQLVADLTSNNKTRAQVLRAIAEDPDLNNAEFNRAFVLMQFFGYLRRNPNDAPDADYSGYDFWLSKLNQFNGNFIDAEMVKAFLNAGEYRQRFGP